MTYKLEDQSKDRLIEQIGIYEKTIQRLGRSLEKEIKQWPGQNIKQLKWCHNCEEEHFRNPFGDCNECGSDLLDYPCGDQ